MEQNINLDYLNIFQLRDYARQVGVKSPSTKKRAILILEINNVLSGKTKPFFPPAVYKGRPPLNKVLKNIENFANIEATTNLKALKKALQNIYNELGVILKIL